MPKIPIILIFYIYIINMNKEGDNNPSIHNYAEGITAHQTQVEEIIMLNTIITATTIITGITGTTLGIKAAITDRRQDKTLNTLNESMKRFDERMKRVEEDCSAMAPAVQQLLAIAQQAAQPQPAPQPAPVAAAPAQAPQQAEQPAPQTQQATTTVQVDQPEEAPAVESTQEPATKQKAPETQPKTPATKTGANKKNTKKEVNTNAMPAAVVAAK